jgi:hypothetical protein
MAIYTDFLKPSKEKAWKFFIFLSHIFLYCFTRLLRYGGLEMR